jgi:hypothetical protein
MDLEKVNGDRGGTSLLFSGDLTSPCSARGNPAVILISRTAEVEYFELADQMCPSG